ncbi:MAG: DMT family transporter [Dyella sp.]|uniref:DMT family transporter n=1 Tax=Dyella sp. TaxID=1869338 RepID=UPI003F81D510
MAALSTEPAVPEVTALPHRADVLAMVVGAALLSCTSIFVVLAQVGPAVSAFYRMLFGGVTLLGWVVVTGRWRPIGGRDVLLALLPALGLAGDLLLWHRSILWVGPGVATLLTNFQVFLLARVGVVAYRERLAPAFWPGMVLALAGLWLLVGAHWSLFDAAHRLGVWFGLASCLAYTVYLLSFRRALSGRTALAPAQFLGLMSLLCAAALGAWCVIERESLALVTLRGWSSLLALGLLGQVVAWLLIVRSMPRLPASLVGLLLLLQPALAFVLDVALFGRPTVALDWCGLIVALAGILLGTWRPRRAA